MSLMGRVSRASSVQTAVRNCTRDEGGPFEAGRQGQASNHCKLCAVVPGEQNNGWRGFVASDQRSFPIGRSSMSAAEHQKPCELRGSCTVLGARGGEIPPRDSPIGDVAGLA